MILWNLILLIVFWGFLLLILELSSFFVHALIAAPALLLYSMTFHRITKKWYHLALLIELWKLFQKSSNHSHFKLSCLVDHPHVLMIIKRMSRWLESIFTLATVSHRNLGCLSVWMDRLQLPRLNPLPHHDLHFPFPLRHYFQVQEVSKIVPCSGYCPLFTWNQVFFDN